MTLCLILDTTPTILDEFPPMTHKFKHCSFSRQFTESLMFYFFGFCWSWVELLFFPDSQSCAALFSVIIAVRLQITFRKITFQNKFSGLCKNRESCWEYGPDPCKWRFVTQHPHTLVCISVLLLCWSKMIKTLPATMSRISRHDVHKMWSRHVKTSTKCGRVMCWEQITVLGRWRLKWSILATNDVSVTQRQWRV